MTVCLVIIVFLGCMILSGGSDGLVALSSPTTGMTVRVISDHKGAPITSIDCAPYQVCNLHPNVTIQPFSNRDRFSFVFSG